MFPADIKPLNITKKYPDDTIKVEFDAGYTGTRARHTRSRLTFEVDYFLTETQKNALESHYKDVTTVTPFEWMDTDLETHTVRFSKQLEVTRTGEFSKYFKIKIELREV